MTFSSQDLGSKTDVQLSQSSDIYYKSSKFHFDLGIDVHVHVLVCVLMRLVVVICKPNTHH